MNAAHHFYQYQKPGMVNAIELKKSDDVARAERPEQQTVILRIKLSDAEFGLWEERERLFEFEDQLKPIVSAVGEYDGHEIGDGWWVSYMYGASANVVADAILAVAAKQNFRTGSSLIKRFGPPGAAEEKIAL